MKISVAMATYNGSKYIQKQLESILCQLGIDDEIVISDDGSTDGTLSIVEDIDDDRINIYYGPRKGLNSNFQNAIAHCEGDVIFICDQDDYWYPNKKREVLRCFDNMEISAVQHDARVIDASGKVLETSFARYRHVRNGVITNWVRGSFHGCCMAFRRELIVEIMPIIGQSYLYDQWIGIVAEMNDGVYFLDKVLMDYRRHENNASSFLQLNRKQQVKNRVDLFGRILKYRMGKL